MFNMSDINSIAVKSVSGTTAAIKREHLTINNKTVSSFELYIRNHEGQIFQPILKDSIKWETSRKDSPGKLTFTVIKDDIISFNEGSIVIFKFNGMDVFYGYVFEKTRDKDHHIKVLAYDQIRYLKNKHTYIYKGKTASELVSMIAEDFGLNVGELSDTGFKLGLRIEDNNSLIDIIQFAISETCLNTGQLFTLFDNFGKITLKNIKDLVINDLLINADSTQNFDYKTTLDNNVYNKIVLYADEDKQRSFYVSQDTENISRWGVLQLTEKLNSGDNPTNKANTMLSYFNKLARSLTLKNVFGDVRVRAGTSVYCQFDLGDIILNKLMLVDMAIHNFSNQSYFMDLVLIGL